MSWVTISTVLLSFFRIPRTSSGGGPGHRSTAPNGSSISSTGGSAASARATPTRWRWPPDSASGRRSRTLAGGRGRRGRASRRPAPGSAPGPSRGGPAPSRRSGPPCGAETARRPGARSRRGARRAIGRARPRRALHRTRPAARCHQPVDHLQGRRLAAAEGPISTQVVRAFDPSRSIERGLRPARDRSCPHPRSGSSAQLPPRTSVGLSSLAAQQPWQIDPRVRFHPASQALSGPPSRPGPCGETRPHRVWPRPA